jgi:hypothetical protein
MSVKLYENEKKLREYHNTAKKYELEKNKI